MKIQKQLRIIMKQKNKNRIEHTKPVSMIFKLLPFKKYVCVIVGNYFFCCLSFHILFYVNCFCSGISTTGYVCKECFHMVVYGFMWLYIPFSNLF